MNKWRKFQDNKFVTPKQTNYIIACIGALVFIFSESEKKKNCFLVLKILPHE